LNGTAGERSLTPREETEMDFVTAWKASSIVLTGAFGILGLVKDYKDKTTNRITVWGRVSLSGILLSTILGVAAQLKESSDNAAKALALAEKTDKTLREVERLLTPIEDPRITLGFRLPCTDAKFERFCKLAQAESFASPDIATMSARLWKKWPVGKKHISLGLAVRIFKDEASAEKYIHGTVFTSRGDPSSSGWYGDMFMQVTGQNYGENRNLAIVPEGPLDQIDLLIYEYQPANIDELISSGRLISTADLSGAIVIIEEPVTKILEGLKVKFAVFSISFGNGQHFAAQEPLQQISLRSRTAYRCTLPVREH